MTAETQPQVNSIADIPGWFPWIDQVMFEHLLSPTSAVPRGNLVELGVYLGKSAALIGRHVGADETFTVCDLFGTDPGTDANRRENAKSYAQLTLTAFEHNYLSLFDHLPTVVQDYSSTIVNHVEAGSVRFLHVDASHLYEHVAVDVESARELLLPDGVVVFDDYRSDHTPGVSAAVWEAVFTKGLKPICVTTQKLYGTFGSLDRHQELLRRWLMMSPKLWWETQEIADRALFRVAPAPKPKRTAVAAATAAAAKTSPSPATARRFGAGRERIASRLGALERRVRGLDQAH
jgi:methyltransferase family protein